jgi:hypothetical protein
MLDLDIADTYSRQATGEQYLSATQKAVDIWAHIFKLQEIQLA